jgi:hypothetical protein
MATLLKTRKRWLVVTSDNEYTLNAVVGSSLV